jgi:DNA-binding MarR family transcriptional regulator
MTSSPRRRQPAPQEEALSSQVLSEDESIGTALRTTFRAFSRDLGKRMASRQVTLNMWFVLRVLWQQDGLSQIEICRTTEIQPSAAVALIRAMVAAGLVRKRSAPDDGRRAVIALTPKGRALEAELTREGLDSNDVALRGFSPREIESLLQMLKRLRQNLAEQGMQGS